MNKIINYNKKSSLKYSGWELKYFDISKNFRMYQYKLLKKFLLNDILEVGAGNGAFAKILIEHNYKNLYLTEINKKLYKNLKNLNFSNKIKKNRILNKKISNIKKKFDTILYLDVLEHINNHEQEINNAIKKLKKNGHLVISVPAIQSLYSKYDKSIGHYRRYNKEIFIKIIKKLNLKCETLLYFDSIGLFFLILNKILNLNPKKNVKTGTKLWNMLIPISKFLDKIFMHKFGKSLICVIKK